MADKLTYVQVLELHGGTGPKAPRERNMLNIMALLPQCQPLRSTLTMLDKSQSIGMGGVKSNGVVPTMACNADMWALRDGRSLSVGEIAKLMGHKPEDIKSDGLCKTQVKKMFGMSLHKGTAGSYNFIFHSLFYARAYICANVRTHAFVFVCTYAFDIDAIIKQRS